MRGMKTVPLIYLILLALFCLSLGCKIDDVQEGGESFIEASPSSAKEALATQVRALPCYKEIFIKKSRMTGVLKARETAVIKSEVGGLIKMQPYRDGSRIRKNDILLMIDDMDEQYALEQAKIRYNDATVKRNDLLLQFGGTPDDETSVKPTQLKMINATSGYLKTIQDIKELEYRISRKKIRAPFDGTVSDVKVKAYEFILPGQEICLLIQTRSYEVAFMVMEHHALKLKKGQSISTHPLQATDMKFSATVVTINPKVSNEGLVEVRATLNGNAQHLYENMNMIVTIEERTKPYVIIPKTALVRRAERTVVFTYEAGTKTAKWNYVTVAEENDTHYAISEGLKVGQMVIYDGNLNLDHDADVILIKEK